MNKQELIDVYEDTKEKLDTYDTGSTTSKYTFKEVYEEWFGGAYTIKDGNVSVVSTDTITTALSLRDKGKTCILNMASERRPGGGVRNGQIAQEECLFRCTDLYKSVVEHFYPIGEDECLYTNNSLIIKDKDYGLINPMTVDCITIPAINLNKLSRNLSDEEYEDITKMKIRMMLALPQLNNCDNLILGAWGCGVFKNDPHKVSQIFKKVLDEVKDSYKNVIFGVINDINSVDNNYEIFKNTLN